METTTTTKTSYYTGSWNTSCSVTRDGNVYRFTADGFDNGVTTGHDRAFIMLARDVGRIKAEVLLARLK